MTADGILATAFRTALVVGMAAVLSARPPVRLTVLAAQVTTPQAAAAAAAPQATGPQIIDRIVAVVGERPILLSEVDETINVARGQGLQVPSDSAQLFQLRRQVLSTLIDEEIIYQRAHRDTSINVTDAEVNSATEQQYRSVHDQFHTEAEFRTAIQAAGWGTTEEYRRYLSEHSRRDAYGRRYIEHQKGEGKLRSGTVSEAELRQFFAETKARGDLQHLPPTVTFRQIVISPRPSVAERAAAFARADSVRGAIDRGADFATLARRFSDDPTTKDNGGDLGFFRRGQMVRPFEEAAFSLRPGTVSPVVTTEYGYHVIMVDRVQPGEVKARHILFAAAISPEERDAAHRMADSVSTLLHAGASPDSLARTFGDSSEPRSVGPTPRDQLPPAYAQPFAAVLKDQVVGPVALNPETPDRTRWLVAQITDVQAEREPTFEDVREQVRVRLLEQKGIHNLVEDLKKQTYVDVRL